MYFSTLTTAVLAIATPAFAAVRRCADMTPSPQLLAQHKSLFNMGTMANPPSNFTIPYYMHVVTTAAKAGTYPQSRIDAQVKLMKLIFAHYGITLSYKTTDYTINDTWATTTYGTQAEIAMKSALRKGTYADLNHYYMSDIDASGTSGLLGQCYFPVPGGASDPATVTKDGCILSADTMPGGGGDFGLGKTAVHETGHWFGLLHPFQGSSCFGDNDLVNDTPYQSTATSGCPEGKNSCPKAAGNDSIHNYMDYSSDSCYNGFSNGQRKRLQSMYGLYRAA